MVIVDLSFLDVAASGPATLSLEVHVPLSEHEQRLLSQMEEQLLADDPKFASAMRGSARGRSTGHRVLVGGTGVVVGMTLLVLAVAIPSLSSGLKVAFGVCAFLVMLAGAGYAMSAPRTRTGPAGVVGADGRTRPRPAAPRASRKAAFMERLEQRWQHRRDER